MDEIDRETRTKFHQPDRRLAEVQDRERRAGSERDRRAIRREYYREGRRAQEDAGEGRKYADRADMVTGGRDNPIGMRGPSADEVHAMKERGPQPVRRGRSWAIGWEPKR